MIATALLYKETGFNWMPVIPENWETKRAKAIFQERSIKGFPDEPLLAASQKQGVVLKEMLEQRSMEAVQNFESFKLVEKDDFVISLRSFEGGIELAYYRGIISPVYSIFYFRENKHNRDFFKYLFKSRMFIQELNVYKKGIRDGQSISYSEFANIYLPVPPKAEQDEIVQYIKAKEEKINHFIEKMKRFIELLKEQKSTIVKSKFSNSNENWKRRKISHSFKIIGSGTTPESGNSDYYDDGEINWINTGDLNDGYLDKCEKRITKLAFEKYSTLKIYPKGTLLIALYGATIGKVSIMNIEGCTNQACCALFGSDTFYTEFLFHWFIANRDILIQMSYGGGQPNISQEIIRQLRISCPSIEEQKQIVSHIITETATIDAALAKAEREIELIREYKEAMIAEAVMGKMKL